MKSSAQIRQEFIDFFVHKHGHTFVPSSPVVPLDDPTLLFTNAGMNQFKPIFLGQEKRAYTRAVNTQKCIRAGGKHNDLDDVGRSRRHHTFFEMLGNWSFGDYFKREAITWSWELLTKVWGLDPSRLHVSCFEGDEKNGVPRDTESANIWKEVAGLADDHIHYFGKDNFWEMGDTGPCGPCTEIYVDRTPDKSGGKLVNGEDPRVMEIWNNVFIQYNRNADRTLTTLPARHVDTGMGFERITQVLQDVQSNYEIDLFNPFWEALSGLSGVKYGGTYPASNVADPAAEAASPQLRHDIAFRVIADHVRCLTFALTDGAVPSNEGRGYVLRRILRRAVRFGRQQLELREPFLHKLVDVVVGAMGGAFPELKKGPGKVAEIIREEEVSFGRTLERGIELFEEAAEKATKRRSDEATKGEIAGADAFMLHDTFGFPIDLTRIMAEERGMTVDLPGYEKLMDAAREKARSGGKEEDPLLHLPPDMIAKLQSENVPATDDQFKFVTELVVANVLAIWDGKEFVPESEGAAALILNKTRFYAEMGGQVGDRGRIEGADGSFIVSTTRAVGPYVLHVGAVKSGKIKVRKSPLFPASSGSSVVPKVGPVRALTEMNHTSTHLANWALREVLGDAVQQKGSLVDPEKLRFDFSHGKSLTDDELAKVESLVSACIDRKLPVYATEAPQEQALKINGLRAVFGEKYPPMVRVVSIGVPVEDLLKNPADPKWRQYSIEFCGGTHIANSSEAQKFVITSEESVSKGIRRIVALSGEAASAAGQLARRIDDGIEQARSAKDDALPASIASLQKVLATAGVPLLAKRRGQAAVAELQQRYKAYEKTAKASGAGGDVDAVKIAGDMLALAPSLGGGKLIIGEITGASDDQLRSALDSLKKKQPSLAALLASASDDKVTFIAVVSDDLIAKGLKAGDWVREVAKVAGGGGGGRPQMAQAGGKDPAKLAEALEMAKKVATAAIQQ